MAENVWAEVSTGRATFRLALDPQANDPICRALRAGQWPEEYARMLEILRALADPSSLVLDLGGHVGTFALAAAAEGYAVLIVEASPGNASLLAQSIAVAGHNRARLVSAAIGAEDGGEVAFGSDGPYGQVGAGQERVPVRSVDSILADAGWPALGFVKMDVEGSEVAAIAGASRALCGPSAPPICFESNGHSLQSFGESPASLKSVVASLGYHLHRIRGTDLIEETPGDWQPATCVDYLATKASTLPSIPGLRRAARPSIRALASEALAASHSSSPQARAFLAGSLAECDPALLATGPGRRAVGRLRADQDEYVRALAAAIPEVPPRWRFFGSRTASRATAVRK